MTEDESQFARLLRDVRRLERDVAGLRRHPLDLQRELEDLLRRSHGPVQALDGLLCPVSPQRLARIQVVLVVPAAAAAAPAERPTPAAEALGAAREERSVPAERHAADSDQPAAPVTAAAATVGTSTSLPRPTEETGTAELEQVQGGRAADVPAAAESRRRRAQVTTRPASRGDGRVGNAEVLGEPLSVGRVGPPLKDQRRFAGTLDLWPARVDSSLPRPQAVFALDRQAYASPEETSGTEEKGRERDRLVRSVRRKPTWQGTPPTVREACL